MCNIVDNFALFVLAHRSVKSMQSSAINASPALAVPSRASLMVAAVNGARRLCRVQASTPTQTRTDMLVMYGVHYGI